ncbi:MAG: GHMP family kinase ATP-binding protein [Candidatus Nitrosopumilus sp. bin_7KS]
MIISKTPLRLSLAGGGTDLPEYYSQYGSHIVTSAIDKHIYIFVKKWFEPAIRVSYSKTEIVEKVNKIQHPFIRESLRYFKIKSNLEATIMADLPAGTGMGSSSSFAVGLLNALSTYTKQKISKQDLAELAFKLQHSILKEAGGKQDQYAAVYGGIISMKINKQGKVDVEKLKIKKEKIKNIEDNLLCFYTGIKRSAPKIQDKYCKSIIKNETSVIESLHEINKMSKPMISYLKKGDINEIGELFELHWNLKKKLSDEITNRKIDRLYNHAKDTGAIGGKILGAGGGGYLLFLCKNGKKNAVKQKLNQKGLIDVPITFNTNGSIIDKSI